MEVTGEAAQRSISKGNGGYRRDGTEKHFQRKWRLQERRHREAFPKEMEVTGETAQRSISKGNGGYRHREAKGRLQEQLPVTPPFSPATPAMPDRVPIEQEQQRSQETPSSSVGFNDNQKYDKQAIYKYKKTMEKRRR
ncbi:hypothetical protein EOD39_15726 [Acipenser ruthenus]|uniref:Uncharacterized protein n=1 Tax=Acipenser ruthenus TaxID=7906 RepID=A0A444UC54_ACIRT|nr:hypothetical protein EOD39_15726 [Acipenser ruthenus]